MVPPEKKYFDIQSSSPFTCSDIPIISCAQLKTCAFEETAYDILFEYSLLHHTPTT